MDGKLECFYHGWQFDSKTGEVDHIPFLLPDKQIPPQAKSKVYPCVEKYHLIWVWPGDVDKADESLIPCYPEWLDSKLNFWGQTTEMPVDHALWVENLMDLAHTPFVHDGQFARRSQGKPLRYDTRATKIGLKADVEFIGAAKRDPKQATEWVAPCTSIVRINFPSGRFLHIFFYSIPMAPGMTRFVTTFYRDWGHTLSWMGRLVTHTPLRHMAFLASSAVQFQDMIAMTSQTRNMKEGAPSLSVPIQVSRPARQRRQAPWLVDVCSSPCPARLWCGSSHPIMQCDEMALMYRRWYQKAFMKDVWWKGWTGDLDIEDLTESVGHSCFGADSCGQYERDISRAHNAQPYVERWAFLHHKADPFKPSWAGQAALVLSAGAIGALGAVVAVRMAKAA